MDEDFLLKNDAAKELYFKHAKDMPIFKGKKRYFCSQGLEVPRLIDNPDEWYLGVKPDWQVKTKNGVIMRFVRGNSTLVDNILEGADV